MARIGKTLSFDSDEQYRRFEKAARFQGFSPSQLCQAIADGKAAVANLSADHLNALSKGVLALLEEGDIQAARLLSEMGSVSGNPKGELERLGAIQWGVVEQIFMFIKQRQPFQVVTKNGNQYRCHYGDIWNPPFGQPQLRAWVEEVRDSDEPPEIAHNRAFRLDRITGVQSIAADWRFAGLDHISVTLEFQEGFRYTPHFGDHVETSNGKLRVIRPCWAVFWLLQDIGRYGDRVVVVSPDVVRDRVISRLKAQLEQYEGGGFFAGYRLG